MTSDHWITESPPRHSSTLVGEQEKLRASLPRYDPEAYARGENSYTPQANKYRNGTTWVNSGATLAARHHAHPVDAALAHALRKNSRLGEKHQRFLSHEWLVDGSASSLQQLAAWLGATTPCDPAGWTILQTVADETLVLDDKWQLFAGRVSVQVAQIVSKATSAVATREAVTRSQHIIRFATEAAKKFHYRADFNPGFITTEAFSALITQGSFHSAHNIAEATWSTVTQCWTTYHFMLPFLPKNARDPQVPFEGVSSDTLSAIADFAGFLLAFMFDEADFPSATQAGQETSSFMASSVLAAYLKVYSQYFSRLDVASYWHEALRRGFRQKATAHALNLLANLFEIFMQWAQRHNAVKAMTATSVVRTSPGSSREAGAQFECILLSPTMDGSQNSIDIELDTWHKLMENNFNKHGIIMGPKSDPEWQIPEQLLVQKVNHHGDAPGGRAEKRRQEQQQQEMRKRQQQEREYQTTNTTPPPVQHPQISTTPFFTLEGQNATVTAVLQGIRGEAPAQGGIAPPPLQGLRNKQNNARRLCLHFHTERNGSHWGCVATYNQRTRRTNQCGYVHELGSYTLSDDERRAFKEWAERPPIRARIKITGLGRKVLLPRT